MSKGRSFIGTLLLLGMATLPLVVPVGAQQPTARARQIGMKFKCMCGMCTMTAGGCSHPGGDFAGPCQAWALPALQEVDELLRQGKTEEEISEAFVRKYGTGVYAEPPKSGFSLVAWAMPTVYLVSGAVLVIFVISRWRKKPAIEAGPAGSAKTEISPELLERARALAARETED